MQMQQFNLKEISGMLSERDCFRCSCRKTTNTISVVTNTNGVEIISAVRYNVQVEYIAHS